MDLPNEQPPDQNRDFTVPQSNLRILYVTFGIVIALLLLWILMIMFSKDPVQILPAMNSVDTHVDPVNDIENFDSSADFINIDLSSMNAELAPVPIEA